MFMRNQGIVAGVLSCLFGILGILTIGIIFVPLAALCSVVGLLRGIAGPSIAGIATSLLGVALTVIGFISSPTLWLLAGGLFVASQSNYSAPSKPGIPTAEKSISEISGSPPDFDISSNATSLPRSGPNAWCRQGEVLRNIMKGLNSTTAMKQSGEHVIDFENSTTTQVDSSLKAFSCHGIAHLSDGQFLPGTFSVKNNAAGDSIWDWMND
jgi:hypothetical protein